MAGSVNLAGSGKQLDASLNTIISEFKMLRDATGVMRKVSTKYNLEPHSSVSKVVLNYSRLVAYGLSDGVDMAQAQDLADTQTTYTPAEVGVQIILADTTLRRVADPDLAGRTGRMMSNAYDLKEDQDGTGQLVNFTPIIGAASTVLGVGHVFAAGALLKTGNSLANPEPAPKPYYGVFVPSCLNAIAGRVIALTDVPTGTNRYTPNTTAANSYGQTLGQGRGSSRIGDEILVNGPDALGRLGDIEIYEDANFTTTGTSTSQGVFSREGVIYTSEMEPKSEQQRDASLRATEMNMVGSCVWGLFRSSAYGVEILGDSTLPSG